MVKENYLVQFYFADFPILTNLYATDPRGPLYKHGLTFIPACNDMLSEVWDKMSTVKHYGS